MFFSLLSVVIQWTLDSKSFDEMRNDSKPLVVRFMSTHSSKSLQLDDDWNYFAKMYENATNVNIAHINCGKYRRLCIRESEWNYPGINLYFNKTVFKYDGGMSHDSLSSWMSSITGIYGNDLKIDLLSPNNKTFHQLLDTKKCVFSMFYAPHVKEHKVLLKEMEKVAGAFHDEKEIGVCEVDVDKFRSFYFDYKLRRLPKFVLYTKKENIKYKGHQTAKDIVDFVNDYCDMNREVDGTLNDEAGVVSEAEEFVQMFMKEPSEKIIESVKKINNTKVYVEIMENILSSGKEWLTKEDERIGVLMKDVAISAKKLDKLKIRSNIISVFMSF